MRSAPSISIEACTDVAAEAETGSCTRLPEAETGTEVETAAACLACRAGGGAPASRALRRPGATPEAEPRPQLPVVPFPSPLPNMDQLNVAASCMVGNYAGFVGFVPTDETKRRKSFGVLRRPSRCTGAHASGDADKIRKV